MASLWDWYCDVMACEFNAQEQMWEMGDELSHSCITTLLQQCHKRVT